MIPIALSVLALAVLVVTFHLAHRSKRPGMQRLGAAVVALGLSALWVLPYWIWSSNAGNWRMPMFIGALFVAASLIGLGIQLIARASGAPPQSEADRLFDDLIRHNDLP